MFVAALAQPCGRGGLGLQRFRHTAISHDYVDQEEEAQTARASSEGTGERCDCALVRIVDAAY